MAKSKPARDEGMALIMAVFFIGVGLVVVGALMTRSLQQRKVVEQYEDYTTTFQGLEAALSECKVEIENGEDGILGMENWTPQYDQDNQIVLPEMDADGVTLQTLQSMQDVSFAAYTARWENDGRDSNGDGVVDDVSEKDMFAVYLMAKNGANERQLEVVYEGSNVNVWENAIFAGAGQSGGLINGNVSIHGSVHLLGDSLLDGAMALAAIDLSGTSLIHNNYVDVPAYLQARVPALPQTVVEGETVYTLEAKLRAKAGLVGMSGNSEIGEPQVAGNNYKETMDGLFVTSGWTGNSVVDDGDRGDPKAVFSDNGWDELYDLGDKVPFPLLTDDWRDPDTGAKVQNAATGTWYTHQDYFNQVLVASPTNPSDGTYTGNITLNVKTSKFYWNATTGQLLNGSLPATAPAATDDYIWFDSATDVMKVNGQIRINGNLSFTGQGGDRTVNYSGRAALLVYGDVSIDANLITCNNGVKTNTANSFPVNNILGIMASNNMVVGSTAQLDIMGAFYAQKKITSAKQTNVMGTFVSNYFDMGTNVPNIYQVPALADNLPLGMIGNYPILAISQVSWRELGI
jgi:hypothetical protein